MEKNLELDTIEIQHQKELLCTIINTQEVQLKKLAQDLHDDISSKLNVISLNCHLLKTLNISKDESLDMYKNIIEVCGVALKNSRDIVHNILPPVLDKFGLDSGLEELCLECSSSEITIEYKNSVKFDDTDHIKKVSVFRILKELINNSLNNCKATKISVDFELFNNSIKCLYHDNGSVFFNSNNDQKISYNFIEGYISLLNGKIEYSSKPNIENIIIFYFNQ